MSQVSLIIACNKHGLKCLYNIPLMLSYLESKSIIPIAHRDTSPQRENTLLHAMLYFSLALVKLLEFTLPLLTKVNRRTEDFSVN